MCMSGAETSWHLLGAYEVQSGELGLVRTVEVSLVSFSSEIIIYYKFMEPALFLFACLGKVFFFL